MTELALRDQHGGELAAATTTTVARLADWAEEARAAYSLAATLCKTSFVPQHFYGKPEEATAAILTGHEMGMSPMAALRAIYVIKGTPGMYALAMRGVVQSKGHDIWVKEATATRAIVCGRRKGTNEVQQSVWTVERAKTADLMGNAQYRKNPQNMLTARATAEVCRLVAADALHGIPYAVEELDDGAEPTAVQAEVKPPRRRAQRAALPAAEPPPPTPEPAFDEEPPEPEGRTIGADPEPPVGPEPMSGAQQKMMFALFKDNNLDTREDQLAFVSGAVGRDVTSRGELTKADATVIIDALLATPKPVEPEPAFEGEPS